MKAVTFGELLLRLEPAGYYRFVQCDSVTSTFGGAEANVAVSLANFGIESTYVTKLPEHEIGQWAVNSLRRFGVDTSLIVRGGNRVGIYFNERGASQRPSKCIYDRSDSAISQSKKEDFNWKKIFDGAGWFHLTGVTPALGKNLVDICIEACKTAQEMGLTVSLDLNYRSKLWSKEEARCAMEQIAQYVDICIANESDARDVFGIECGSIAEGDKTAIETGHFTTDDYVKVAAALVEKYHFKKVAITLRKSQNANFNKWSGILYDAKTQTASIGKEYDLVIVDRLGGGDSFSAGLIYSLMNNKTDQEALDFAVAASCLKHTIEGDFNMVSVKEVQNLMGGDSTGRIQR